MLLLGWGSRLQHERPAQIRPRGVKNEKKSSSWSFKLFRVRRETKVRLQILNKGEWRREKNKKKGRQRDTMKPSAPRKNYFRGGGWNKSGHRGTNKVMKAWRIFSRKMTHFFHLRERERTPAYQSANVQYTARAWVTFFACVLPAIVLEIIWHINHVDVSLFPPRTHAICFQEGDHLFFKGPLEKRALMPSKRREWKKKKKEREQAHFIEVAPPPPSGEIKPMCIREEGTPSDIKAPGRFLSEVLCIIERGISRKKVRLPVQPAPPSTPSH